MHHLVNIIVILASVSNICGILLPLFVVFYFQLLRHFISNFCGFFVSNFCAKFIKGRQTKYQMRQIKRSDTMYQTNFKFERCRVQESNLHGSSHGVPKSFIRKRKVLNINKDACVFRELQVIYFNQDKNSSIRSPSMIFLQSISYSEKVQEKKAYHRQPYSSTFRQQQEGLSYYHQS